MCCPVGCLHAIGHLDFLEDVVYMGLDRVGAQAVGLCYFLICQSSGQSAEDVQLTRGKLWRSSPGFRSSIEPAFEKEFRHQFSGNPNFGV